MRLIQLNNNWRLLNDEKYANQKKCKYLQEQPDKHLDTFQSIGRISRKEQCMQWVTFRKFYPFISHQVER